MFIPRVPKRAPLLRIHLPPPHGTATPRLHTRARRLGVVELDLVVVRRKKCCRLWGIIQGLRMSGSKST